MKLLGHISPVEQTITQLQQDDPYTHLRTGALVRYRGDFLAVSWDMILF